MPVVQPKFGCYDTEWSDRIWSIEPSDYLLTPSEMHAKLTSYADMADNKMRRVMQHPQVVSARDWMHETVRNVGLRSAFVFVVLRVITCAHAASRCCFAGVYVSVCVSLCLSAQNLENY